MVFNSVYYLFFFTVFVLLYYLVPIGYRYLLVLAASYYFYACWDVRYTGILLYITAITYILALVLSRVRERKKKNWIILLAAFLCFGLLFYYKYAAFFFGNLRKFFNIVHFSLQIPILDFVLPIGISFYIFQAFGYIVDVYRGNVKAEKNFFRYASFVSFFPNLLSGPIERADNLLKQLQTGVRGDLLKVKRGLMQIAWGLFLKLILSNQITPVVNEIFDKYEAYRGIEFVIATFLFGVQIYCDFAGYSLMAIGSARVLGFELRDNFRLPYFANTTGEFWRRWHISLTSWFRDYLYIPLGGNRKGEVRKCINTLVVFTVSGLWHGASWGYIFWGFINGMFLVIGDLQRKIFRKPDGQEAGRGVWSVPPVISIVCTFVLIDYAWMFFRADSFSQAIAMTRKIFFEFWPSFLTVGDLVREFGGIKTILVLLVGIFILWIVDYLQYRTTDLIGCIFLLPLLLRWGIYLGLLFLIIVFGGYGYSYEQTQFIYFQF